MRNAQQQSSEALNFTPFSPRQYCIFSRVGEAWECSVCKRKIPTKYTNDIMPFSMCSNPKQMEDVVLVRATPATTGEAVARINRAHILHKATLRHQTKMMLVDSGLGVGAEVKRALQKLRIDVPASCSCNSRLSMLDEWGPELCVEPEYESAALKWLLEEATKRLIPYTEEKGKKLLRIGIRRATKNYDKYSKSIEE
jgi:hypothetical protein